MKIFIYLCALLPLTVVSSASEKDLLKNIVLNTETKKVIRNVSTFMFETSRRANFMAEIFYKNISDVRLNYGEEKFRLFQKKYGAQAAEFGNNPKLSKDCPQYIADILKDNEKHQNELSEFISKAVDSLRIGFSKLYSKLADTRITLANVQQKAYDCGVLLEGDDGILPYNCLIEALREATAIEDKATGEIFEEVASLSGRITSSLKELNESVKDRAIPNFYDEDRLDRWLKAFCSV